MRFPGSILHCLFLKWCHRTLNSGELNGWQWLPVYSRVLSPAEGKGMPNAMAVTLRWSAAGRLYGLLCCPTPGPEHVQDNLSCIGLRLHAEVYNGLCGGGEATFLKVVKGANRGVCCARVRRTSFAGGPQLSSSSSARIPCTLVSTSLLSSRITVHKYPQNNISINAALNTT